MESKASARAFEWDRCCAGEVLAADRHAGPGRPAAGREAAERRRCHAGIDPQIVDKPAVVVGRAISADPKAEAHILPTQRTQTCAARIVAPAEAGKRLLPTQRITEPIVDRAVV